jgi:4-diphosphocytidyl-2-C-methyl-D-erythritol kinase
VEFYSPAKINVFFRVLRKRSDGYHEIASLYLAIDLCDRLFFVQDASDFLTCSDPNLSTGSDNLIAKALHLFRSRFPIPFGVKIHLEKNIPMQAGLGGGSSNAATTLWALNALAGRPASLNELIELGSALGSDVAFFFSQGSAYCTGRGERLEPHPLTRPMEGWIAKPPFGLSTPLVYRETRPEELPPRDPLASLAGLLSYNDLEPASFRLEPRLASFRGGLERMGFDSVTMTGTGTAFFCLGTPSRSEPWLRPFRSLQRPMNEWYQI